MTVLSAVQDGSNRLMVTVTASQLTEDPDGTTVFQFSDGHQEIVTASNGTAAAPAHTFAGAGTYSVTVFNGNDSETLMLPPVAVGLAWPAATLTVVHDPDGIPLGVEATVQNLVSTAVTIAWGDTTTDVLPLFGGAAFKTHKYAEAGTYDIAATAGATTLNSADFPVAQVATVVSLSPDTADVDDPPLTMTVTGTGFVNGAVVFMGGISRVTTYISATQVSVSVDPGEFAVGNVPVLVRNPGVANSNAVNFAITNA
jgi:hypothetical protein